jgi:hypothetical protein
VSRDISLIFWTRLLALTFVTAGRSLHADATASSDGYKIIPVNIGGKTVPIRVLEQGDPYKNVSSSDTTARYDPERIFSTKSSMSDKQFALPSDSQAKSDSDFKNRDQDTFITKAYDAGASSPADTKARFPTTGAYTRNATGFDKSYPTSGADAGQSRTVVLASATSPDQGRTADLGSHVINTSASTLGAKTFQGPEADAAHRHLSEADDGKIVISDLPNRPLSIDEVRNLINHGFKPDTNVKPEEPSKPLNDPNYKPEPLRETPAPSGKDNDENDPVPPPGTMSAPPAPENSEPLPQP